METGTIIKIISNHCTITTGDQELVAIPSGKVRQSGKKPLVGDKVEFERVQDSVRIEKILPRRTQMFRPPVTNVDQALIVTSCKDPDFSIHLMNRLMFLAELSGIEPVICLTKLDLITEEEKNAILAKLESYQRAGHKLVITYPGSDDAGLAAVLKDKVSLLCGQSGAGKSSLLNRLEPDFHLQTQEISKALGRGRHTTRHCQLHDVAGGLVADTPGFSSLDFSRLDTDHMDAVIPEFAPYLGKCRFKDCRHLKEPDCAVKDAVNKGEISRDVWEDYRQIKEEEQNKKY